MECENVTASSALQRLSDFSHDYYVKGLNACGSLDANLRCNPAGVHSSKESHTTRLNGAATHGILQSQESVDLVGHTIKNANRGCQLRDCQLPYVLASLAANRGAVLAIQGTSERDPNPIPRTRSYSKITQNDPKRPTPKTP